HRGFALPRCRRRRSHPTDGRTMYFHERVDLLMLLFRFAASRAVLVLVPIGAVLATWLLPGLAAAAKTDTKIAYNRDIRPILSNNWFKCHGPDGKERQADLRLDVRDEALRPNESGRRAIVPGKPASSALVRRIFSTSETFVMPPPESNKKLTAAEKELLK